MSQLKLTALEKQDVISKVAKNHRNKCFSIYTPDDIEQQAWVISLEKIDEFVPEKGKHKDLKKSLEHWLNRVVHNRLSNFKRDKYLVPQRMMKNKKEQKSNNLLSPFDISTVSTAFTPVCQELNYLDKECWEILIVNLDNIYMDILECLLSGENINCYYRNKLYAKIKEVLGDQWNLKDH